MLKKKKSYVSGDAGFKQIITCREKARKKGEDHRTRSDEGTTTTPQIRRQPTAAGIAALSSRRRHGFINARVYQAVPSPAGAPPPRWDQPPMVLTVGWRSHQLNAQFTKGKWSKRAENCQQQMFSSGLTVDSAQAKSCLSGSIFVSPD